MFKGYGFVIICLVLVCLMKLCGTKAHGDYTGREYMPDMAHSQAYEVYVPGPGNREAENVMTALTNSAPLFADGKVARQPVPGTIPRGYMPFGYPAGESGYESSAGMHNPIGRGTKEQLAEGKALYVTYCTMCHGAEGKGKGKISVAAGGPLASIPNYFSSAYINMPEGKMYHTLQYGKNLMGSYASQMSADERWKVVAYVKEMQAKSIAASDKISIDEAYAKTRGSAESMGHGGGSMKTGSMKMMDGHGAEGHMQGEGHGEMGEHSGEMMEGEKKDGLLKRVVKKGKEVIGDMKEKRADKKAQKDNQH